MSGNGEFQKDKEEYFQLLEQLGIEEQDPGGHGNRAHRRFNFDLPETAVTLRIGEDACLLYDVSVGGLSFFSKKQYDTGEKQNLEFDGRYDVDVEIMNSVVDKAISKDGDLFIRHGVRFVREGEGYKCVVAVLKHYLETLKSGL